MAREFLSGAGTFANPLLSEVSAQGWRESRTNISVQPDVRALNSLAVRSLISLYDEPSGYFSGRATLVDDELHLSEASRKHSIVALLGLHQLVGSGESVPFDLAAIRDAVLRDNSWVRNAGELGLLTWFAAVCAPEHLDRIFKEFDFENSLSIYADGRQGRTNGLAWFLAGLAHARLARPSSPSLVEDLAVDAYHLLTGNQGDNGIFGHAAQPGFPREALYARLGSFSDQIYSIYALSEFARAFQVEEPLDCALSCADAVCGLQGDMGQWWFLYDKRTTKVVNPYPVFSVHQDGTAPCGLLALEEATGRSFQRAIFKGLPWVSGANELGADLRNFEKGVIWHSIGPSKKITRYWKAVLGVLKISPNPHRDDLTIRYECRPDHFGWLLYGLGKFGLPETAMAAKASSAI